MFHNQNTDRKGTVISQNFVKDFEANREANARNAAQNAILEAAQPTNYALDGASLKTKLYWLFSCVAAAELSAAVFFYLSASFSLSFYAAILSALAFGIAFHYLAHAAITSASVGIVFDIGNDSRAARLDVLINGVTALILCATSAACVYFIGRPAYQAYRATAYVAPASTQAPTITGEMLLTKSGKLSVQRANAAANLSANANTNATAHRKTYDQATAKTADIVGASAFVLEVLLLILGYGIATAGRAATIARTAAETQTSDTATPNKPANIQPFTAITPTPAPPVQRNPIGFYARERNAFNALSNALSNEANLDYIQPLQTTISDDTAKHTPTAKTSQKTAICAHCNANFERRTTWQKYCAESCKISAWELKTGKQFKPKA